jgi:hypothetical protein
MQLVEDLSPFFADFGDAGALSGVPVRVIYDAPGTLVSGINTEQPSCTLPSASVPASVFRQPLVIPQGSFLVERADPDGTGITRLWLSKA